MKVVVFSPYYPPAFRAGGPVKSISRLVRASREPFSTRVVSRNWDLGGRERLRAQANRWVDTGEETVWMFDRGVVHYARALVAAARERPRLVYVNSLFDPWLAIVPALVWRAVGSGRSELVIAPRGQLATGPLAQSAARKRPFLWLWRRIARHPHAVVHAATEREKADIERMLGRVRVIVRPNDVGPLLPAFDEPSPAGELRAVFLGRIVPIKGLLELIRSLHGVEKPMSLDVYGPEEDYRYTQLCQAEARRLPAWVLVQFKGPVASEAVRSLLARYDVMLNPTRGESFGQAIGESLSAGTPVAVPPVTPWTPWIEEAHGGRIVRDDRWAEAIHELTATRPGQLRRGARNAYMEWWSDAQGQPHVFELVVPRLTSS